MKNLFILGIMHELTDNAVKKSKIPAAWLKNIKEPKTIVTVKFPVHLKNGELETITGTRIIHSNHQLPSKGGLRFSTDTTVEDLEGLACLMSYKASLHDLPFGGAKGCIFINPKKYSYEDKVRIIRRYTVEMWKRSMIGASTDVMGPDLGTDERMMNIIKDTYKSVIHQNNVDVDAVVTGKGVNFGGLSITKQCHGYGTARTALFLEENLKKNKILLNTGLSQGSSKKSVILHEFNENSYNVARFLIKSDFKIVGITDGDYACFNSLGFDPVEIWEYKKKNDTLQGVSRSLNAPMDVISQKCDIFITCSKELGITKEIAENIKCKILIEGSNSPLTKSAMENFAEKNILVIPDILAYAGGFIASYLEWLKNLEHKNLTLLFRRFESNSRKTMIKMLTTSSLGTSDEKYSGPEENQLIYSTIEEIIDNSFNNVLHTAEEYNLDLRMASFKIAIEKIYEKSKTLGEINI